MSGLFDSVHQKAKPKSAPTAPAKGLDAVLEKLEELGQSPRKWKFTIARDDNGRLSEITAEAQD